MPLLNRARQIAIAPETTEGVLVTPLTAAHVARNISEVNFSPEQEEYQREHFRASIGRIASIPGVQSGRISYRVELQGTGDSTDPFTVPSFDEDLKACGYTRDDAYVLTIASGLTGTFLVGETVEGDTSNATGIVMIPNWGGNATTIVIRNVVGTFGTEAVTGLTSGATATLQAGGAVKKGYVYYPVSTFVTPGAGGSVSVVNLNDGVRNPLVGCRGNFRLRARTGEPLQMEFEFAGPRGTTVDAALLTGVTYPSTTPPRLLDVGLHLGTYKPVFDTIELSPGNELDIRRDANSAAGLISTWIVRRQGTGSIDPEKTLVSVEDWYGKFASAAEFPINLKVGTVAGNTFYVHAPKAQYSAPSEGVRGAITTMQITLNLNERLGDDELIIAAI